MKSNRKIGEIGEKLAAEYLAGKGYKLVARNWFYKQKEIDIIARDGDILVIVEVKLRFNDEFGHPRDFVSMQKQRFLIEAAEAYLDTVPDAPEVRFDVIAILGSEENHILEHIDDAFNP